MTQSAHVPPFGNWEDDGKIPYTQFFENARKNRSGGKIINPNDPQENPEAFRADVSPVDAPPFKNESSLGSSNSKDELSGEGDHHKPTTGSPHHKLGDPSNSGDHHKRAGRISGGSDNSVDHSPLHPNYQTKAASRIGVTSSPFRNSSESSLIVGRSRMRTGVRGEETPERGSTVPKFGEWDESNPSSADGFSHIFEKVREEKQTGSVKVPMITNDSIYFNSQNGGNASKGCCCFSWFSNK